MPPGFSVAEVYPAAKAGSIVNLTFDADGVLVVAKENGPVVRLRDTDGDGVLDAEQVITDAITNCQGLLFAGRDLLATCDGPGKPTIASLYRVPDANGDGVGEAPVLVARSTYSIGEHGAHALVFGPDGDVYWMIGNFGGTEAAFSPQSPFENAGEEQLLPVMGDARGHGNQVRAPAGFISRMRLADILASTGPSTTPDIEIVAGGFRNAYDAAFNLAGELFTFDSDMEWDINLPWYRPVRTLHLIPGADFGFRYGSGPFPTVYPDTLPSMSELGRGSPVGVTFYQGEAFPRRVSRCVPGRRLVARPHPRRPPAGQRRELHRDDFRVRARHAVEHHRCRSGAGRLGLLRARRPAHAGAACIASGTRKRRAPARRRLPIRLPARWRSHSRARRSDARPSRMPVAPRARSWDSALKAIVSGTDPGPRRARALELLHVHGQKPDIAWLTTLSGDSASEVRAAAVLQLGLHRTPEARTALVARLKDQDAFVQRRAVEALVRSGVHPTMTPPFDPVADVLPLLSSPDRHLRYAARHLLRRVNRNLWREAALAITTLPGSGRRPGRPGADRACADRRPADARSAGGADRCRRRRAGPDRRPAGHAPLAHPQRRRAVHHQPSPRSAPPCSRSSRPARRRSIARSPGRSPTSARRAPSPRSSPP